MERGGTVYIITNFTHTTLYTGVTSDIMFRVKEHKDKEHPKSFPLNTIQINWYIFVLMIQLRKLFQKKRGLKAEAGKKR